MALDVETPGLDRARGVQTPPSWRALGYWAYSYKRTWRGSVATSFLIPVLYLAAMGVGLGSLVDQHSHTVDHVRYLYFLAPGLLASTAMQIGTNEATYPVMGAIKWIRTYFAMLATPLSVNNVLLGTLSWIAIRLTLVSAIYLCVLTGFGAALSPLAVLALPAAVLTGLAFSAPIAAFAATVQNDTWFSSIYRFGVVPLFLFSGTFFPVTQLPAGLRPVAYATPLYHGVTLCREFVLGQVDWAQVPVHAGYLIVFVVGGYLVARKTFRHRLIT
jgi:lipooligosaccharide transport system permease protein